MNAPDRRPYPTQRLSMTDGRSGGMAEVDRHNCRIAFDAAVEAMRAGDLQPLEQWTRLYGEAVRDMIWSPR